MTLVSCDSAFSVCIGLCREEFKRNKSERKKNNKGEEKTDGKGKGLFGWWENERK